MCNRDIDIPPASTKRSILGKGKKICAANLARIITRTKAQLLVVYHSLRKKKKLLALSLLFKCCSPVQHETYRAREEEKNKMFFLCVRRRSLFDFYTTSKLNIDMKRKQTNEKQYYYMEPHVSDSLKFTDDAFERIDSVGEDKFEELVVSSRLG